jgi:thiol-disulfide isomerase/thioredoxin
MRFRRGSGLALTASLWLACGGAGSPSSPGSSGPPGSSGSSGPPGAVAAEPGPPPAIRGEVGQIPLRTLEGQPTTLAAYGARVTVVALWASYCRPCLDELPYIEALHQMYRDRPEVSVVAVNMDDTMDPSMRAEVRDLLDQLGVAETPCLLDGTPVMERLTLRDEVGAPRMALPLLVVVDPAFRLHRRFGFRRGISRGDYLADKSAIIEAALRGDEPNDPPPPALPLR